MANGTRSDSISSQNVDLEFQFLKNGAAYGGGGLQKVEIYGSEADAIAGTSILETIDSTGFFTEVTTGLFGYTATAPTQTGGWVAGTYFDRVYVYTEVAGPIWDGGPGRLDINPFYVREETFGGAAPGSHEKVIISLNLFDVLDSPRKGCKVEVEMNVKNARYGTDLIKNEKKVFYSDEDGNVTMTLIETTTLSDDTFPDTGDNNIVYYKFNIDEGKLVEKRTVTKGLSSVNYFTLPEVAEGNI